MRLRTLEPSPIGRELSLGVHGIVIPQVRRAEEARAPVDAAIEDGLRRITDVGGAVPGTFCKKDAAARLIEIRARFLYTTYDA